MKAIVTGADGFVGSALVGNLLANGYEVLALDISPRPVRLKEHPSLIYLPLPIENIEKLESEVSQGSVDFFFHLAWRGAAGSLREDEKVQLDNALLTASCLREAAKLGCRKFVCSGSIMEYEANSVTYEQGTKPALFYIYGAGKAVAHVICKPIANALGISLVWAYITNAYGVGESSPRFLNSTLRKIRKVEKLEFTAGVQNYDFVYVDDVAEAFRLLAEKGHANKGYMIGSGQAKPLKGFIEELIEELKPKEEPRFGNVPYTGVMTPLETFDISEIVKDCGFRAKVPFREGVRRTYEWLKATEK